MRIQVTDELERAIMVAAKLAPVRGPRPELQLLTLTEGSGSLGSSLEASDGELTLCYRYDAPPRSQGVARVPAHRVAAILKATKHDAGEATLEVEAGRCVVVTDDSRFELVAEQGDGYSVPRFDDESGQSIGVELEVLTELVALVAYAASREVSRFTMEAIRLELADRKLEAIATDGRRLAIATAKVDSDAKLTAQVRATSLAAATKILEALAPREQVEIKTTSSQLMIRAGAVELSLLAISGNFAPFRQVIPESTTHQIEFAREDLIASIKLASLCSSKESLSICFGVGPDGVELSSQAADIGEASVKLPALSIEQQVRLGFNPAFLVEGLKACSCESILFGFSDSTSAAVITCAESIDGRPDLLYVLMPINLGA